VEAPATMFANDSLVDIRYDDLARMLGFEKPAGTLIQFRYSTISDPGYAIIVRLTDGIGPLKPAYGIWQKPHALFLKGDMFSSKFMTLPSKTFARCPVCANIGGCPVRVGGGKARNCASASLSMF